MTQHASNRTPLQPLSLYKRLSLLGTSIVTVFSGRKVGEDKLGNRYFEQKRPAKGTRARRWVVYASKPEASAVPPEWHGWLHYTLAAPLAETSPYHKDWQQPHQPNLTGTTAAYHPPGAQEEGGRRARATGDYEAWTPGN